MLRTKAVLFQDVDLHGGDSTRHLEDTRFFDCDLTGAEFSKATAPGVRFHGSTLFDLKGSQYLAGAVIDWSQVLPVGLGLLSALRIAVDDERDPSSSTGIGSSLDLECRDVPLSLAGWPVAVVMTSLTSGKGSKGRCHAKATGDQRF